MKYTNHEELKEIILRSEKLRKRREWRNMKFLSASAAALFALLAVFIGSAGQSGHETASTVYGAFLLSPDAGGYILAAVIAFAVGIVVAMLIYRQRYNEKTKDLSGKGTKEDL